MPSPLRDLGCIGLDGGAIIVEFDPVLHHRRSIRLPDFDYSSAGAYFVTIVTAKRAPLFGDISNDCVVLNLLGSVVSTLWQRLPMHFDYIQLDEWVLMPNHLHAIIWMLDSPETEISCHVPQKTAVASHSLGAVVGNFKSVSARRINRMRVTSGARVWQTNYYERIVRDDDELLSTRQYIAGNPAKWADDAENPFIHNSSQDLR